MPQPTRKGLRFTHLSLENWRNFARVEVDLQRRVFLVGPNASGKSNLLDVFRFLRDLASVGGGFQDAVARRGGVKSIRCLAARRFPDVSVRVHLGDDDRPAAWSYELRFGGDKSGPAIIKAERVEQDGALLLRRPDGADENDTKRLTQTNLEQVFVNQSFREIGEFFSSVRYLHVVPQLIREPDRSGPVANDPFGRDLLERIARASPRTREARLARIRKALQVAVPQLADLELKRDARGVPHLHGNYAHWRPQGAWQTEGDFSDGTLRLMGLLWALHEDLGPLLLEEPELSLHPEVVRYIPQMLARVQRSSGRQVLMSTHSADLLRDEGIGLDEVLLLEPSVEGTSVRAAGGDPEVADLVKGGVPLSEAVIPRTRPEQVAQLAFALE